MNILLVVDMQHGFMHKKNYVALKNKINEYIKNSNYDKYIFTRFKNKENSFYTNYLNWHKLMNDKEQELCVYVPKNSIIMDKYGYGLDFKQIKKIKKLVGSDKKIDICGLKSNCCVTAIALQLFDNNVYPNILINYVATNENLIEPTKLTLTELFGKVDKKNK